MRDMVGVNGYRFSARCHTNWSWGMGLQATTYPRGAGMMVPESVLVFVPVKLDAATDSFTASRPLCMRKVEGVNAVMLR